MKSSDEWLRAALRQLRPDEVRRELESLAAEDRALTERELAKYLLTEDLESFSEEAWRTVNPQDALSKGPRYWQAMCEHLTAVTLGQIRRLIITIPPRTGKSTLVSILWPAWSWARDNASSRWLFCSHGEDLAIRHSVKRRELLASAWFQYLWGAGVQFSSDMNLKCEYSSTNGGEMYSTWIGGSTGRGADVLVIDDPHSLTDAYSPAELEKAVNYCRTTLFTRLNNPGTGAIVIIMQRLHENDLAGELMSPSRDERTERLDVKEQKSDPPAPRRTGYEMFTSNLVVPGIPPGWKQ
jgi:hypothetical protein